jgi:hypothetical protein
VRTYDPQHEESRDVFLTLLRVYMQPTGGEGVQVAPALRVLTDHHGKMDAAKVQLLSHSLAHTLSTVTDEKGEGE